MTSVVAEVADALENALASNTTIAPIHELVGAKDIDTAYAVQAELARRRKVRGGRPVGRKVGLTSDVVQAQLGVGQPDFGILFADMQIADGGIVRAGRLIQPKVEAEVAFVLEEDLDGGANHPLDLERVRSAVAYAVAAIEIVDSRITNWDIDIVDTVADNGSSAMFVLGSRQLSLGEFEPRDVTMALAVDGQVRSTGTGDACMGDPLAALLWLAQTADGRDEPLRAGDIVLSGALGPMLTVVRGTVVTADIRPLGSVSVEFSREAPR